MTIHVEHDPRQYLLAVMAVALIAIVPLGFGFVTTLPVGTGANGGSILLSVLLGVLIVGLLAVVFLTLARATRLEEQEHGGSRRDE